MTGSLTRKRIYRISLVLVWLALLLALTDRTYIRDRGRYRQVSFETGIVDLPSDAEWLSVLLNGKKIGYAVRSLVNLHEDGYRLWNTTQLRMVVAGNITDVMIRASARVDTLFHLKYFDFHMLSGVFSTHVVGEVLIRDENDVRLRLKIEHGEEEVVKEIPIPETMYSFLSLQPMLAWRGLKAGERMEIPIYDPLTQELDDAVITHRGREIMDVSGKSRRLNRVDIEYQGTPTILWLDDDGLTVREESFIGLALERTTPEEALAKSPADRSGSKGSTGADIYDLYGIPVQGIASPSDALVTLRLQIDGIDPAFLLVQDSPRQKVVSQNPLVLELRQTVIPDSATELEPYLKATDVIQSNNPRIRSVSRQFMTGTDNAWGRTERMVRWVYDELEKRPVVNLPSALEIMNARQGDCSEHTTLFTAFSRSLGIPTRVNLGLVFLPDGSGSDSGRFMYHAWPEVYIDSSWIPVDPTLGQNLADVTHITLLRSDFTGLGRLAPLLGQIAITVLETEYEEEDGVLR